MMSSIDVFRDVPYMGVIHVVAEAAKRGFTNNHPDWCNLGQGQPEVGAIAGAPARIDAIHWAQGDQAYGPVAGTPALRQAVADHYNRLFRVGKRSQYRADNVAIAAGGRLALSRLIATLGAVRLGYQTPDYTAYEDLLASHAHRIVPVQVPTHADQGFRVTPARLRAGEFVAVPARPSADSIVAVIAVLKAGGAYIATALTDLRGGTFRSCKGSGVRTCIVSSRTGMVAWKGLEQVIAIDSDAAEISDASAENLDSDNRTARDQACVIRNVDPKGRIRWMRLAHENVTSMLASLDERLHFARFDAWSLAHSLSSSIALIELWGALLHGSQVTIAADMTRAAKGLDGFLVEAGITVLNLTPREFLEWVEVVGTNKRNPLHTVIMSGEPLRAATLRPWFDLGRRWPRLIYLRGHRELAIASALWTMKSTDAYRVSRGMLGGEPLSCCRVYILDRYRQPVPIGVVGDLYVAGRGVVRGGGAGRESARRAPEPLDVDDGYRLWKTGDRAYWTAEGKFELLFSSVAGATTDAEAVRIESELLCHPSVRYASVALRRNEIGGDSYVAYVEGAREAPEPARLRAYLEMNVPRYMVPREFVCRASAEENS